ncbi:MAG TPA: hypothetical protein VGR98_07445 [Streptosporangiaceae bacterium]|nr:hypothetical protein [Streptosporangiaceae bacterium]
MLDTAPLRDAYRALLDAAAGADQARSRRLASGTPTRSWPSSVASGANTTYDNRMALDAWTIKRLIARVGGSAGLRERVRRHGESLCALGGPALSEAELDTLVPTLLLSKDTVLVDQPCR